MAKNLPDITLADPSLHSGWHTPRRPQLQNPVIL